VTSVAALLLTASAIVAMQLPAIGAGGLLHPMRRRTIAARPPACDDAAFQGVGITLRGWRCRTPAARRGTIVYLHGIADNRSSAIAVIDRFGRRGFDVVAYDSRAHGESQGGVCTFGFLEKQDLHRVVDTLEPGPVVLLIHGDADRDTPPDHSRRVFAALSGPKRFILVPGARHNESLRAEVWDDVERWLDGVLGDLRFSSRP